MNYAKRSYEHSLTSILSSLLALSTVITANLYALSVQDPSKAKWQFPLRFQIDKLDARQAF